MILRPFFSSIFLDKQEGDNKGIPQYEVGDLFELNKNESLNLNKKYELVDFVDEVNGVNLDSYIIKQIEGEVNNIYSLTKHDCDFLGIKFQEKLQIVPKKLLSSIESPKYKFFNEKNLSTYPRNRFNGTIHNIIIEIGQIIFANGIRLLIMDNNNFIKFNKILITSKCDIFTLNDEILFKKDEPITFVDITKKLCHGDLISDKCLMYLELNFSKKHNFLEFATPTIGIDPYFLKNKKINDLINIYFYE